MNIGPDPFTRANYHLRKSAHDRWQQQQSQQHILRSQLGFNDIPPSRPKPCQDCIHYHGMAYGRRRETHTVLICGFHPYGWDDEICPDWQGE